ncbi:MAG: hypothetical protein WCJ54_02640 [Actinomycetota bacterium]
MLYHRKLLISDKYYELYEYEKSLKREYTRIERKKPKEYQQLDLLSSYDEKHEGKQLSKRKDSIARTRSQIRRTINANPDLNKFITLTFAENLCDVTKANRHFSKFIMRLKYIYDDFKYISIIEFQHRGAVHYHFLCNIPYIDSSELSKLWGQGFIKINRIHHVDNLGAYVCKYLQKDMQEARLFNRKKFFKSQNLQQSIIIYDDKIIEKIIEMQGLSSVQPVYKCEFANEWVGMVKYNQFKLE